jgi:uncharacterized membrane protein YgcG
MSSNARDFVLGLEADEWHSSMHSLKAALEAATKSGLVLQVSLLENANAVTHQQFVANAAIAQPPGPDPLMQAVWNSSQLDCVFNRMTVTNEHRIQCIASALVQARAVMLGALPRTPVGRSMVEQLGPMNPYEMLRYLENYHGGRSQAAIASAEQDFLQLRWQGGKVGVFLAEAFTLFRRVQAAGSRSITEMAAQEKILVMIPKFPFARQQVREMHKRLLQADPNTTNGIDWALLRVLYIELENDDRTAGFDGEEKSAQVTQVASLMSSIALLTTQVEALTAGARNGGKGARGGNGGKGARGRGRGGRGGGRGGRGDRGFMGYCYWCGEQGHRQADCTAE